MKNYKHLLKLALLQLKEYSDNELIIIGGEQVNIDETLKEIVATSHLTQEDEAKEVLEKSGKYLGNTWCLEDVQASYKCTDDEAYEVLDQALQNDATMSQIWFAINFHAEDNGLEKKIID